MEDEPTLTTIRLIFTTEERDEIYNAAVRAGALREEEAKSWLAIGGEVDQPIATWIARIILEHVRRGRD
jgi:hypothetical protein